MRSQHMIIFRLGFLSLALVLLPSSIFAAPIIMSTEQDLGTFSVSPSNKELQILPGASASFTIRVTNNLGRDAVFNVGMEDLGVDVNGDALILDGTAGENSLQSYIKTSLTNPLIGRGETIDIPVSVTIPISESRPGLYGAITISVSNQDITGTSAKAVSRIGVPILVSTTISPIINSELVTFDTVDGRHLFSGSPVALRVVYKNNGNVYVRPTGEIRIMNMLGKTQIVKMQPWFVLPGATRAIVLSTEVLTWPGRYEVELNVNDGYGGHVETVSINFWILPWRYLLVIIGIFILAPLLRRIWRNVA